MGLFLNLNYLPHWARGLCDVQMLVDVFDSDNLRRLARLRYIERLGHHHVCKLLITVQSLSFRADRRFLEPTFRLPVIE